MNNVILVGRLASDPTLAYTTTNQTAKCTFSLAVDRPRRNGEDKQADFPRIVVWGKQAENCDRYLGKGRQVAVRGSVRTGSYKDHEGRTIYTTDIWAENVEFLGGGGEYGEKAKEAEKSKSEPPQIPQYEDIGSFDSLIDDIPF